MQAPSGTIGEGISTGGPRRGALAPGQVGMVIGLGVVFWFAAAMIVRVGAPLGIFGSTASVLTFALTIPGCWLAVLVSKQVARLAAGQTVPGIVLGTVIATFCDGLALTWARGLFYGSDLRLTTLGAGWIFWGVGLFLLFAYLNDHR